MEIQRFIGVVGLLVLLGIAYALSTHRRRINWRPVIGGLVLQLVLALLVLRVEVIRTLFDHLAKFVTRILSFTDYGTKFIFGALADNEALGKALYGDASAGLAMIFAIKVLPTIIFFASLMGVLYHLGLMQKVVQVMAYIMTRVLRVSGAESLAMGANVFVGQTEAPLVIKPYVSLMTRSELMALMTGGFATIAGSVFGLYCMMLGGGDPAETVLFAKHLLTASLMSAPAAFVMAKIIVPETEESVTAGVVKIRLERTTANLIDAAATGAGDGLKLALNVAAMLLAFVALIALVNYPLEKLSGWGPVHEFLAARGVETLSLSVILGWVFSPLAYLMGVPWSDATAFGGLLGEKIVATELIAFKSLAQIMASDDPMQFRSKVIASYALCGFANFGSIAIQIGGIGGIAPDRRRDLASLGLRAMIGGALASWMTATIAGILWMPE
jgi:CNT family concentrative nucleoside transporter